LNFWLRRVQLISGLCSMSTRASILTYLPDPGQDD
jgi:hypothetical protein